MAKLHDTGYKFLFSHAELVRELLEVFAPEGLAERLDFATLRPEKGSFVTPAMKQREDDIVWSVSLQGQRIYLYLLLEFQSSIDKGMPVRMMQYVAALYDHLLRGKQIDLNEGLPPVLPIVIYNGDTRWHHSAELFDLIAPHPDVLTPFQPHLRFWLLDEGSFSTDYLTGLQRVMAAIFRMEHAHDLDEIKRAIRYLGQTVANSPLKPSIDKAVMAWMQYRLSHKMPSWASTDTDDFLQGTDMIETNMERIRANLLAQGLAMGRQEGRQQGRQEGRQEGETLLLERQLTKRFGPLTDEVRMRLKSANPDQLALWSERILDASTLAQVFAAH